MLAAFEALRLLGLQPAGRVGFNAVPENAPGCEFDLDGPALQCLAAAQQAVHGTPITQEASTATTDARHFKLMEPGP